MPEIHRLVLPTPFPVGPVNVYVLRPDPLTSSPLTMVDAGPAYQPARQALLDGLSGLGLTLADFGRILLTHPHIDHYGLASEVAAASEAEVVAHVDAAPRLGARLHDSRDGEREALEGLFAAAGAPEGFGANLLRSWQAANRLAVTVGVDRTVSDGDTVEGGGWTWRVISTPGHSPGSVCYYEMGAAAATAGLISGDHLLPDITSNAIMEFGPGANHTLVREKSLMIYIQSLRRVERLVAGVVYPGHGEPFSGHQALIRERFEHYENRKASIFDLLKSQGPSTVFAIAGGLFPKQNEPMGQFLAISEVIGHLDLLEADGRVARTADGPVDLYSAARSEPGV